MSTKPKKDVPVQSPTPKQKDLQKSTKPKGKKKVHAYMRAIIEDKATNSFTFRYPPGVLNKLEEITHQVWGKYRVKLTKNSMAVMAMAYLLWDFEVNGKKSILFKMLIKKARYEKNAFLIGFTPLAFFPG